MGGRVGKGEGMGGFHAASKQSFVYLFIIWGETFLFGRGGGKHPAVPFLPR